MAIEEEFSIEIPDKEADNIHSGMLAPMHHSYKQATDTSRLQSRRLLSTSSTSPMPSKWRTSF
jgi:hypothetical protein